VLPQFGWGQQAVGRQTLQVDKIGISGGGARGLVRAIAIGGRIQRQYLPAGLTGGVEKIHKIIGFAAETADAVFSRQAADGHNDTGFVGKTEILFVILKNSLCDKVSISHYKPSGQKMQSGSFGFMAHQPQEVKCLPKNLYENKKMCYTVKDVSNVIKSRYFLEIICMMISQIRKQGDNYYDHHQ
jgi:hypothetical protein